MWGCACRPTRCLKSRWQGDMRFQSLSHSQFETTHMTVWSTLWSCSLAKWPSRPALCLPHRRLEVYTATVTVCYLFTSHQWREAHMWALWVWRSTERHKTTIAVSALNDWDLTTPLCIERGALAVSHCMAQGRLGWQIVNHWILRQTYQLHQCWCLSW